MAVSSSAPVIHTMLIRNSRVRRDELNDSESSGGSDAEDDAQLRAQLEEQIARSLGLDTTRAPPAAASVKAVKAPSNGSQAEISDAEVDEEEDAAAAPEEYDFALFGGSDAAPTKVVLDDDKEPEGEAGIVARRPASFYVRTSLSAEQKQRIGVAAVSGDDVLARSGWRSWSMELPWKVTHITVKRRAGSDDAVVVQEDEDQETKRRRRPGKKRRLALRAKERAKRDKVAEKRKQEEDKEEHVKEKKKRLNRLKKLRRRQKEREKKLGHAEGGSVGSLAGGDSDDSE